MIKAESGNAQDIRQVPPAQTSPSAPTGTQVLERGLDLLDLIVKEPSRLNALTRNLGYSKTTAWRLVQTLLERGFVVQSKDGNLSAGPKLLQLGAYTERQSALLTVGRPYVIGLAARAGHSAYLARRDGTHLTYLFSASGRGLSVRNVVPGTRQPLLTCSLGRALALDDPEFFAPDLPTGACGRGHSVTPCELAEIVTSEAEGPDHIIDIAAPIRDLSGRIAGAVGIAAAMSRSDQASLDDLAAMVAATAIAVSGALAKN